MGDNKKEIKVIREIDVKLSREERNLYLEELSKLLKVSKNTTELIGILDDEYSSFSRELVRQTIPMLIIKQIAKTGFAIPIVREIPQHMDTVENTKKFLNVARKPAAATKITFGSGPDPLGKKMSFIPEKKMIKRGPVRKPPAKRLIRTTEKKLNGSIYSTSVHFEMPQNVVSLANLPKFFSDPKYGNLIFGDKVDVCGFVIIGNQIIKQNAGEISGQITSGNYNIYTLQNNIFKPGETLGIFNTIIIFKNEPGAMERCREISDFIIQTAFECRRAAYTHSLIRELSASDKGNFQIIRDLFTRNQQPLIVKKAKGARFKLPSSVLKFISELNSPGLQVGAFEYSIWFNILFKYKNGVHAIFNGNKQDIAKIIEIDRAPKIAETAVDTDELEYRWNYVKKYGIDKFAALDIKKGDKLRNVISKREILLLESDKEQRDYALKLNEKRYPWSQLVLDIAYAPVSERIAAYYQLKKYMPKKISRTDWIRNKDGVPIICPHVADIFERPNASIIEKYADNVPIYGVYYCKICGEEIGRGSETEGRITFVDDIPVTVHKVEDELKEKIRKNVMQTVSRIALFKTHISHTELHWIIDQITDRIYSPVDLYEKKLRKIKTMAEVEFNNRFYLITLMYCYAYLIKLTQDNPKKMALRVAEKAARDAKSMIKFCTDDIIISLNALINKIPGIDKKYIEESFLTIYRHVLTLFGVRHLIKEEEKIDPREQILLFPLWSMLKTMKLVGIVGRQTGGSAIIRKILGKLSVATTLNLSEQDIGIAPFAKVKNSFPRESLKWQYLNFALDYINNRVFKIPYATTIISKSGSKIDVIVSINSPERLGFLKRHANLFKLERENIADFKNLYRRPYVYINEAPYRGFPQFKSADEVYLALDYGYEGKSIHAHKWTKFYYTDSKNFKGWDYKQYKNPIIYTRAQIQKGELIGHTELIFLANVCEICGYSTQEAVEIFGKEIKRKIEFDKNVENFYNYYSFKCPKLTPDQIRRGDQFHLYAKTECKNCGFKIEFAQKKNLTYYEKYKGADVQPTAKKRKTGGRQAQPQSVDLKKWTFNVGIINEFVKETIDILNKGSSIKESSYRQLKLDKQSYFNIVNNFGLIEQKRIDLITNGSVTPFKELQKNVSLCLERRNKLHGYIQSILILLDIISNYKRIAIPDFDVQLVYNNMPAGDTDKISALGGAGQIMSELYSMKYYEASIFIRNLYSGGDIIDYVAQAQFTFEYLLRLILVTIKKMKLSKVSQSTIDEIVLLLVYTIINNEKITSKLLENKEATIIALQKTTSEYDPNIVDNSQSRTYDDLVDPDEIDKYSYDDIDYDGVNDNWD